MESAPDVTSLTTDSMPLIIWVICAEAKAAGVRNNHRAARMTSIKVGYLCGKTFQATFGQLIGRTIRPIPSIRQGKEKVPKGRKRGG